MKQQLTKPRQAASPRSLDRYQRHVVGLRGELQRLIRQAWRIDTRLAQLGTEMRGAERR